ncbi:MAG: phosphoserine phosphatase RsbU/P, partial [Acidobacteriaceae bacterium]|nr:phosphoserine phosphatase RsbU/P [Acidobacteriaceae bacterium]
MTSKNATRLLYLALTLFIVCSMGFYVLQSIALLEELSHGGEHARMPFSVDGSRMTISHLQPEAVDAGLRNDDRLLELRGEGYRSREQMIAMHGGGNRFAHAGDSIEVAVRRVDGSVHRALIHTVGGQRLARRFSLRWALTVLSAVPPLICLLIGYWVAAARIRDANAWFLLLLFAAPSTFADQPAWWPGALSIGLTTWWSLLQLLAAPTLLLFGIYFPERWRADSKYPWAKWLILVPLALSTLLLLTGLWIDEFGAARMGAVSARIGSLFHALVQPLNLLCVLAYVLVILDKLRSATTADARRRMRLLAMGSFVGLGSLLLVFLVLPRFGIQPYQHPLVALSGFLLFFAAPFSFAYVVVVQRALDVRILLRMGTK